MPRGIFIQLWMVHFLFPAGLAPPFRNLLTKIVRIPLFIYSPIITSNLLKLFDELSYLLLFMVFWIKIFLLGKKREKILRVLLRVSIPSRFQRSPTSSFFGLTSRTATPRGKPGAPRGWGGSVVRRHPCRDRASSFVGLTSGGVNVGDLARRPWLGLWSWVSHP
jgi:hypothetical protein